MARYVWEKYSTNTTTGFDLVRVGTTQIFDRMAGKIYVGYDYKIDSDGYIDILNSTQVDLEAATGFSLSNTVYVKSSNTDYLYAVKGYDSPSYELILDYANYPYLQDILGEIWRNGKHYEPATFIQYKAERSSSETLTKGSYIGLVSSASSSTYPNNGIQSGYWYVYKGSDSIQPTAISIPTGSKPGSSTTITISAPSPTYGGTIKYTYQYSVNNGSWITLATTTNKTYNISIPSNATNIRFRVYADDEQGYTSDYVYSITYAFDVSTLKGYIGINGTAKKIKNIYIGVNGVARKVVKGYIGVNGVARRFL